MVPWKNIRAVLIDFYGTICSGDRETVDSVCRAIVSACELPLSAEELAVRWGRRFFDLLDMSRGSSFRTLYRCETDSLASTLAELEDYWRNPPLYADALQFVRQVGLPLCCVSNADSDALTTALNKHGLRFSAVVSSEEVRAYKPDPAIFEQALDRMDVAPHEAVHIGDSLHSDIRGAKALGIPAIWVRRESRIHDIGSAVPDQTVTRLTDLLPSAASYPR